MRVGKVCFAFTPPHRVAQSAPKAIPHSTVNHFRRLRHCPTDLTPNMGFLDLPSEVFERVVMHLATHDGVVEAWKHHKVSRTCISALSPHPEYAMTVSKGVNEVSEMKEKKSIVYIPELLFDSRPQTRWTLRLYQLAWTSGLAPPLLNLCQLHRNMLALKLIVNHTLEHCWHLSMQLGKRPAARPTSK
jgi:hypothetical protein